MRYPTRTKRRLKIVLCFFCFVFSSAAWGQTPSTSAIDRGTKELSRAVREKAEKEMIKPPGKPAKLKEQLPEAKLTGPKFFVKSISLDGVKTLPVEKFKPLLQQYENREVYESEIKDTLTGAIVREYLKKGVIASCFVPPQEIKDGAVTLKVVEAKMGALEATKAHFFPKDRLNYYWPLKPGEVLRYDEISRSLQFMNKNPDREVKATLLPGKKPETTDVLLSQKTKFPLHFTASLDNEGAVSTGKIRKGIGFVENNFLGLDDTVLAGYTGSKNFGGVYAYHRVPITPFGTTVLYGYSNTRAFPKKDFEPYSMSSSAETASAFLYQDLYYKDDYKGELSAGIDAKNKRVIADAPGMPGVLNVDKLRIMRVGIALIDRDTNNFTYIKPQYSQGLNFLGARRKSELSSRQAENTFAKFNLDSQFVYKFPENIRTQIKFSGQIAGEKLTPQEELYMGGIDSVRGYPSGDYLADTGFASNFELLVPPVFLPASVKFPYGERPLKEEIVGVFFFDYGYGSKRGQIAGEQSARRMASVGAGIRIKLFSQADLRLEWGIPLDPLVNRRLTEDGGNRPWLHFSINFQDDIPEEATRFFKAFSQKHSDKAPG